MKVLVVDDSEYNVQLLCDILVDARPDYTLLTATNGTQALALIAEHVPDIVLLDIIMPGMDGYEVCRRIKSDQNTCIKDIPVLLITALQKTEEKVKGFHIGAADYLVRPLEKEEAIARIDAHLKIKRHQDELRAVNEELKRVQQIIIENAKMSAIGSLSAGIAHEFNNILGIMKGYVQLLEGDPSLAAVMSTMTILTKLIGRGEGIVGALLEYAQGGSASELVSDVRIAKIIEQDLLLMQVLLEEHDIMLDVSYDDVPPITCCPSQLSQVFINIIKNAIDAMAGLTKKRLAIHVCNGVIDGTHACIVVRFSDTGCGVPEAIKEKIFEPFVTTKGVVGGGNVNLPGTGLGMAIAYGIVERHNGRILIESTGDTGTTVQIQLPVV